MLVKIVFLATVLLVSVAASPLDKLRPQSLLTILTLQEPCVKQGGICKPISDCAPGNLVTIRGVFCPMQTHLDIECCYF